MITGEERLQAIGAMFLEAEKIFQQTKEIIPEVGELEDKTKKERVLIVGPKEGGFIQYLDERSHAREADEALDLSEEEFGAFLKIYPFFKEDVVFGEIFKFLDTSAMGSYSCSDNMVIVRMEAPDTQQFKSPTPSPALRHAPYAKKESRAGKKIVRPEQDILAEEAKIWTTDYQILLVIGGKQYEQEAKKTAYEIQRQWEKRIPATPVYKGKLLETAYGSAPSEMALRRRHAYFFWYCNLMAVDYYYPPEQQEDMKSRIIRHIHQPAGGKL